MIYAYWLLIRFARLRRLGAALLRRCALNVLLVFLASCGLPVLALERPVTGTRVAGYEEVDKAITNVMDLIGCQAATVAVSKDKQLLYSRGFGWADKQRSKPVAPEALMRIASVTKPITAAAIKKAAREQGLSLETNAFEFIGVKPRGGEVADRRIYHITVRQLLEHKGGWDRERGFDPMFRAREIEAELGLSRPARPVNVIEYMLVRPLQFAPGTRSAYSNFGYCALGRVLEKALNRPYLECIEQSICQPLGIGDIKLGRSASAQRDAREVWYPVANDAFSIEVMDAHGGLIASAPALCRFLDAYWINGDPRLPEQRGNWTFFGSLPGTTAMVRQRMDGFNVAVLMNGRRDGSFTKDNELLQRRVDGALPVQ